MLKHNYVSAIVVFHYICTVHRHNTIVLWLFFAYRG